MKAVILAAGDGSRMNIREPSRHKALERLLGVPIIERSILALRDAGIREVAVVVGHAADELRAALGDGSRLGVRLDYVVNEAWRLGNGTSAYAARGVVGDEPFILAMADHWFDPRMVRALVANSRGRPVSQLCVDRRLASPYDPSDATKVVADPDGRIHELGKGLSDFNGLDCGLFAFTCAIFDELELGFSRGEYSLGPAANRLAERGMLRALEIGDLRWEDVDTREALRVARAKLRRSLAGSGDGIVSRLLNRRLSLPLSLLAIRARFTPNAISLISFLMAAGAGVAFGFGQLVAGAVATQVSSILDGSDGEVARARFMASARGGMLDSILDRVADAVILGGAGYYLLSGPHQAWEALAVFAAIAVAPMSMMVKDRFTLSSGRQWQGQDDGVARFLLASRDGRLFVLFVGGLSGLLLPAMAYLAASGSLLLIWRLAVAWRALRPLPETPGTVGPLPETSDRAIVQRALDERAMAHGEPGQAAATALSRSGYTGHRISRQARRIAEGPAARGHALSGDMPPAYGAGGSRFRGHGVPGAGPVDR